LRDVCPQHPDCKSRNLRIPKRGRRTASEQEYAVKRLEAALKAFGRCFHVYQSLFKSNLPDIPIGRHSCWPR
jgi:hypothetical protein